MKSEAYWEGHQAGCDDAHVRPAAYIDLRREAKLEAASQRWIGRSPSQCEAVVERFIERERDRSLGWIAAAVGRGRSIRAAASMRIRA
jgi:hypothetical protein